MAAPDLGAFVTINIRSIWVTMRSRVKEAAFVAPSGGVTGACAVFLAATSYPLPLEHFKR